MESKYMNLDNYERIALVLPGGGAKGAFQTGALECLYQLYPNICFEVISGVSVGALNGAMLATGKHKELFEVWRNITADDVYRKRPVSALIAHLAMWKIGIRKPLESIYTNEGLRELIKNHVGNTITTNFMVGSVNIFDNTYTDELFPVGEVDYIKLFRDTILASTAIPGIWPPVSIGDRLFVDGGVRNIAPVGSVLGFDPDLVIIIPNSPYKKPNWPAKPVRRDIFSILGNTIETMLNEIFTNDIDQFLKINELVNDSPFELELDYKYYDYMMVDPAIALGDTLDFSRSSLSKSLIHGFVRMEEELRRKQ